MVFAGYFTLHYRLYAACIAKAVVDLV
uniref:Uncharacterized protein n=1 Tax=Anguilla anguilla TaxID=7936 RepID=A0A0E9PAG1_ANGAN